MPKGVCAARGTINFNLLREDLKVYLPYRDGQTKNVKLVSEESGVSRSAISRLMRSGGSLHWDGLVKITDWLGNPVERYTNTGALPRARSSGNTMEDLEKVLRKDKNLTPKQSRILSNLLNSSYYYTLEVLRAGRAINPTPRAT